MKKKDISLLVSIINKNGNCYENLNKFINSNSGEDYLNIFNKIIKLGAPIDKNSLLPSSYNELLKRKFVGESKNLYKMLYWSTTIICHYKSEISNFIEQKKKFDFAILNGNYDLAEHILDDIESISCSMWSLKSRMLISNLKNYNIQNSITALSINEHNKAFALLFAQATDININYNQYSQTIRNITKNISSDFLSAFLYFYGVFEETSQEEYLNILNYCSSFSVLDAFLAVKFIIHKLLHLYSQNTLIRRSVELFSEFDNDNEISFFSSCVNEREISPSLSCQELITDFNQKNYKKICNMKNRFQTIEDLSFIKLNIVGLAYSLSDNTLSLDTPPQNPIEELILIIYNIVNCTSGEEVKISLSKLQIYCRLLKWFDIAIPMENFCKNHLGRNGFGLYENCYTNDDVVIYDNILSFEIPPVFYESLFYYFDKEATYDEIINKFGDEKHRVYFVSLHYILYYVALKGKDYSYALEIFLKCVAIYPPSFFRFSINELCDYVLNNITINDTVTIYEVMFVFLIKDLNNYKETVFKNFLDEYNIIKPLEITKLEIDKSIINYFLREICSIETMSCLYLTFNESTEVENHRIEICKYLLENDEENKSIYSKEISDILKEQEVRKLKKALDASKLSIDYSIIQERVYEDFSELNKKYHLTAPDKFEFVNLDSPVASFTDPQSWCIMALSRDVILEKMFKIYATEFCFGDRGLDTYLSTRVRHGTFENTIKKVFLENYLYGIDNNFFTSMISKKYINENIIVPINEFKKQVNEYIFELTNYKFKVFIESEIDKALFDYNMDIKDLSNIYRLLDATNGNLTTITFIDIMSECVITKTRNYLADIRNNILEDFKSKIILLLEALNEQVKPYCINDDAYSTISNKISTCKTNIQKKIEDIKNWFYLSDSVPMENYPLDKLINVLKKDLQQQFDDFSNIKISVNMPVSQLFFGKTFVYLYDVLQILFTNSIIHSKFDNLSELEIILSITIESEGYIGISVENNLSKSVNFEYVKKSSERINNIYLNNEYKIVDSHKEGGMGQIKVLDILFNVLQIGVDFKSLIFDNRYKIELKVMQEGVICFE